MRSLLQPPHCPAGLKKVHHFSAPLFVFPLERKPLGHTPFLITAHICCKDTANVFKGLDVLNQLNTERFMNICSAASCTTAELQFQPGLSPFPCKPRAQLMSSSAGAPWGWLHSLRCSEISGAKGKLKRGRKWGKTSMEDSLKRKQATLENQTFPRLPSSSVLCPDITWTFTKVVSRQEVLTHTDLKQGE